ncbi:hypothetical protein QSV34_10545 [Porticoccus sp. W117]|uniref:hypothetical protein n=1 Tax=Porticoccus sp. W117 TaxID=3054777 RepID=UPI0025945EA5|nr:hypothetical protein [Porticoccus sp. W117]MDM3871789.1 hypothetical protein [Porticoccus sp. W117]
MDRELQKQTEYISEVVHKLLDGDDGLGQLNGTYETQRVVLDIPKAFTYLAYYMDTQHRQRGIPVEHWDYLEREFMRGNKNIRAKVRNFFTELIYNEMSDRLHYFCHGQYSSQRKECEFINSSIWVSSDRDDDLPF